VIRLAVLALALAAAPIAANAQTTEPREPRSCQQLHEEMGKCEAGMRSCDQHVIDRLQAQCQRDEKRLPQVPVWRASTQGLCGPVYIAGTAELVLLSREYHRFPCAPPLLKSDPGGARTVAPATPTPAAGADAVFNLLTL